MIDYNSASVITDPEESINPYYCTEDDWREWSGYTDQLDFPSSEIKVHLENATEKVKKDGFHKIRWELTVRDGKRRQFLSKKFLANAYGTSRQNTRINHGVVTPYDIEVWEADIVSSISAAFVLQGGRINKLMYRIPTRAIEFMDPINGYFIMSDEYPTPERRVFVTYYICGKPLEEIQYELKMATMEYTTILALRKLKDKRLKKGTTNFTLGSKTIVRNEIEFQKLLDQHLNRYMTWINWFKPFIGRRARVGRYETMNRGMY